MQKCSEMQPKPQVKKASKKRSEGTDEGRQCHDHCLVSSAPYSHQNQYWPPPPPLALLGHQLSGRMKEEMPYHQSNHHVSVSSVDVPPRTQYSQDLSPTQSCNNQYYHWPPLSSGWQRQESMKGRHGFGSSGPGRVHQEYHPQQESMKGKCDFASSGTGRIHPEYQTPSSIYQRYNDQSSASIPVEQNRRHDPQTYPSYQNPFSNSLSLQPRCSYNERLPLRSTEQEMHYRRLQTDAVYQDIYNSSVKDIHAIHQAQLAVQVKLSHLAMKSSIMKPKGQRKEGTQRRK